MSASNLGAPRQRARKRSLRRLRFVLLCLGSVGLVLGVGLFVGYISSRNEKLLPVGTIYVLGSLVALGIHGVLVHIGKEKK